MGIALLVGALQMFHIPAGLITDYGADIFGTAWMYAMARLGLTIFQRGRMLSPVVAATIVFTLCAISEIGQSVHIVPGQFDPYDLAAFGIAVVASTACDISFGPFTEQV